MLFKNLSISSIKMLEGAHKVYAGELDGGDIIVLVSDHVVTPLIAVVIDTRFYRCRGRFEVRLQFAGCECAAWYDEEDYRMYRPRMCNCPMVAIPSRNALGNIVGIKENSFVVWFSKHDKYCTIPQDECYVIGDKVEVTNGIDK